VYDGHAGLEAADFISDRLHLYLAKHPSFITNIGEAFVSAFEQVEREFLEIANEKEILSGTTALVAFVRGNRIIIANTGDSRCILSRKGRAINLSTDHRPDNEKEKVRVEAAGGWIVSEEVLNVPRMYRLHLEDVLELEQAEELIGWVTVKKVNGVLGMTRSIGDRLIKGVNKEAFFDHKFSEEVILATPEISMESLGDGAEFVVLASDGLWDVMSSQEVVDFVRGKLYPELAKAKTNLDLLKQQISAPPTTTNNSSLKPDLMSIAQELVGEAIEAGSLDNTSVIIVQFLNPFKK